MTNNLLIPENAPWEPMYYTEPLNKKSRGAAVIKFAEENLVAQRGFRANKLITLGKWQKWVIDNIFEVDENGLLRYNQFLLMVPRKNGKTFITAMIIIYYLVTAPSGSEIYSAAKNTKQSKIIYELVNFWIRTNPVLSKMFTLNKSESRITNNVTGGFYRALSSDSGSNQGIAPYIVICDELHTWENIEDNFHALTQGSADREESQVIIISTAGSAVDDSLLGSLYKRGIKAIKDPLSDPSFGFFCWQASIDDDPKSPATWAKANPNLAEGLMKEKALQDGWVSAMATNLNSFLRYHLNIWVSVHGERYISEAIWKKNIRLEDNPFDKIRNNKQKVVIGFDGAEKADSTGIILQDIETGTIKIWRVWEKPKDNPEWIIDKSEVMESLKEALDAYDVVSIWADKFLYENELKIFRKQNRINLELIPQSRERKDKLAAEFCSDLYYGKLSHLDEEPLNRHIGNATALDNGSFAKPKGEAHRKIDLFICAMLANGARNVYMNKPKRQHIERW